MRKHIILLSTLFIATTILTSCGRTSCNKQVVKNLQESGREYIPKDMNDAIAKYDFEAARMFVSCESNGSPEELTRAEVSYKISQGQLDAAKSVAREDGRPEVYNMMYMDEVAKQLSDGNNDIVMKILSSWTFTYSPSDQGDYYINEEVAYTNPHKLSLLGNGKGWELYNMEVEQFNNMVDKLMTNYLLDGDKENAKKCVLLFAPIYKPDYVDYGRYNPERMVNPAQESAKKKIK